jgi:hypothetical protein
MYVILAALGINQRGSPALYGYNPARRDALVAGVALDFRLRGITLGTLHLMHWDSGSHLAPALQEWLLVPKAHWAARECASAGEPRHAAFAVAPAVAAPQAGDPAARRAALEAAFEAFYTWVITQQAHAAGQ